MIDPATFDFNSIDSTVNDETEHSNNTALLLTIIGITSIAIGLYLRQRYSTTNLELRNQDEYI